MILKYNITLKNVTGTMKVLPNYTNALFFSAGFIYRRYFTFVRDRLYMARRLCCCGMCKNLLWSDGQQRNYSKPKFPSNLNCGQKIVSETGPRSAFLSRVLISLNTPNSMCRICTNLTQLCAVHVCKLLLFISQTKVEIMPNYILSVIP